MASVHGANLANLILSSAKIQSDLITQGAVFERSLFEQRAAARDQAIQQILAEKEAKKAERKARKKKNATLGIAAVATVLTAGAGAVLFAPVAGAAVAGGLTATGAAVTATGLPLAGAGAALSLGGAAATAAIPSTAAIFTQGALAGFGSSFLGLDADTFGR